MHSLLPKVTDDQRAGSIVLGVVAEQSHVCMTLGSRHLPVGSNAHAHARNRKHQGACNVLRVKGAAASVDNHLQMHLLHSSQYGSKVGNGQLPGADVRTHK